MIGWKKFFLVADSHGDKIDQKAALACLDHKDQWSPDFTAHLGDFLDLAAMRKGASEEERAESIGTDFRAFKTFIKELQPDVALWGNHDARIIDLMGANDAVRAEAGLQLYQDVNTTFANIGCKSVPYRVDQGIETIGNLRLLHGYKANMYSAKAHGMVYGNCAFGHVHRKQQYDVERYPELESAYAIPMLADGDLMQYAHRRTAYLSWSQGWAFGYYRDDPAAHVLWYVTYKNGEALTP